MAIVCLTSGKSENISYKLLLSISYLFLSLISVYWYNFCWCCRKLLLLSELFLHGIQQPLSRVYDRCYFANSSADIANKNIGNCGCDLIEIEILAILPKLKLVKNIFDTRHSSFLLLVYCLLFHMTQLISRNNTKSHHAKRKRIVSEY